MYLPTSRSVILQTIGHFIKETSVLMTERGSARKPEKQTTSFMTTNVFGCIMRQILNKQEI